MGIRLKPGEPVAHTSFSMLSSPVLPGTIQLPPGGQPIILMRDAQTVGGYPRIGQVPDSDLDRMAQLQPGDEVRFRCINSAEAEEIEAEYKNRIALLKRFCEQ